MCEDGSVENEFHFVMACQAYQVQRDKLWADLSVFCDFEGWGDIFKFRFLMSGGSDHEILNHVIPFLKVIWQIRFNPQ